jgi:pumilio RNA-binding family
LQLGHSSPVPGSKGAAGYSQEDAIVDCFFQRQHSQQLLAERSDGYSLVANIDGGRDNIHAEHWVKKQNLCFSSETLLITDCLQ